MKKRNFIMLLLLVLALSVAAAFAPEADSAKAEEEKRLFRFGFAAEYELTSPCGAVEFIAENGAGIVYAFDGDKLNVTAKAASGENIVVAENITATGSVSLDFRWTGSSYKTKIGETEYEISISFGESVATKATLKITGSGVALKGAVSDGGIVSRVTLVDKCSVLTDLGDGLYNIKGNNPDNMVARMDPIAVKNGSVVRISLAMRGYGLSDNGDTWLSLMLGTDVADKQYGPDEYHESTETGAYAAFLMRFYKDGHFMGNTFDKGELKGSIPDISGITKRIEYVFRFGTNSVSVTLGNNDMGTFGLPSLEKAYFSLRTHNNFSSYDVDVQVNAKASASDVEYDLATSPDSVNVPVKSMGTEISGVYDSSGKELGGGECTIGANSITLNESLFGTAEGDARTFYIVSTGGQSKFRVITTDTTTVTVPVSSLEFDKASPNDVTFTFDKHTLSNLTFASGISVTADDYALTDESLTVNKDYLMNLKYGSYAFSVSGTKVGGGKSESSSMTIKVTDSRNPSLGFTKREIDAAVLESGLELPVIWYDSEFYGLDKGEEPVETAAYNITKNAADITMSGNIAFTLGYLESLPYGNNEFTLATSRNSVSFIIVKTDSRAASVAERAEIDKADVKDNFDVSGKWYDENVESVTLDGKETAYVKTLRAVRLSGDVVTALSSGEHILVIKTNERSMKVVLTVSDGRVPERADDAEYDLGFPDDLAIPFYVYDNTIISVKRGGETFPAASVDGNVVTIARSWLESAGFSAGNEISFELTWLSADKTTEKSATIVVGVTDTRIADLGSFDLGLQKPLVFDVNLNCHAAVRVRVGDNYVPFVFEDGKITVSYAALENMSAGKTAVVVETDRYLNATEITFIDDRKPVVGVSGEYFSGDLKADAKIYAYGITAVSVDGNALGADGWSFADGSLTVKAAALGEIEEGNHSLTIKAEKDGETVTAAAVFTVAVGQPPVVTAEPTYSLADGGALEINVDFKNNLALGAVLLDGKELSAALWNTGAYGNLTIKADCFKNLAAGVYKFTLVCDRASGDFTVTVTDTRANKFYTESVSVNAGEKEIALRAQIDNADYKILVDGNEITDYVYEGGAIVIGKSVIKTLGTGTHAVVIKTAGGESAATIEIYKSNVALSALVGAGIGAGILAVVAAAMFVVSVAGRRKS